MNYPDDLDALYQGPRPARRVVSLVPSLTEALASVAPEAVVGATDWCTHPRDLDIPRVRGTKNPNLSIIRDLRPDVVVVNKEENRALDVERLRADGISVWVTDIRSVNQALLSMARLFEGIGWRQPNWLTETADAWSGPPPLPTRKVAMPIWRDPWMVVGNDTFTDDLLRRLGWDNAFSNSSERYPKVEPGDLDTCGADAILLPDEPYVFTATDGPEVFTNTPVELVNGRLLSWYGPSLAEFRRKGEPAREI